MQTSDVEAALNEMDYEVVENMAGLELPCATPAQLTFTDDPEPDMDCLDDALDARDFARLGSGLRRKENAPEKWIFDTDVWSGKSFIRLSIKAWHDGCVRIYPREDGPSLPQLATLTRALELGFDAHLKHDPLEGDDG